MDRAETLRKLDALAGSLARAYQQQGEFCCVQRTVAEQGERHFIYPNIMGAAELSAWLAAGAEALFDGPGVVVTRP